MNRVVLLGPQRHAITVTDELARLAAEGRVAAITAGWQEREGEDLELHEHLAGPDAIAEVRADLADDAFELRLSFTICQIGRAHV